MSYYEDYNDDIDEPFFENDDCTNTLNQLKVEIEQSVKQEIKEELAYLRKENEELKDIKEKFDAIKTEYAKKQRELDETIKNAEKKFAKIKLNELMKFFAFEAWGVERETVYPPKCDKCDKYRQVSVKLPSGKETEDECPTCGKSKNRYYIHPYDLYEVNDRIKFEAFYLERNNDDYFGTTKRKLKTVEEVDYTNTFEITRENLFRTKEEAQKVCNILNGQDGATVEWIHDRYGKVINEFSQVNSEADD